MKNHNPKEVIKIQKPKEIPNECDGCCYRITCDNDLEKCCYLSNDRCIVNEYTKNYLHKI